MQKIGGYNQQNLTIIWPYIKLYGMKRSIQSELIAWKTGKWRKPLLIRGARQVGKTYLVREFAKSQFNRLAEINFELRPEFKAVFSSLDPREICRNLELLLGSKIETGTTLLFFDEIQECPQAFTALRYFYENYPELHVIAAGSLLDVVMNAEAYRAPVGRLEYLHLAPLSFLEFLAATGEDLLCDYLARFALDKTVNEAVHQKLLRYFKQYAIVGGMPEVVKVYLDAPHSTVFQDTQLSLLQTYRDDFGKYAARARIPYLQKVFQSAPAQVGSIYKYVQVDQDAQSRDLKAALDLLVRAGLIAKVVATSGHGLPLGKDRNDKKFKIIFLDVGLMQRALGLDAKIAMSEDFLAVNRGALAEAAIGQELMGVCPPRESPDLYFWVRERQGSQAEVDFLTAVETAVVPIEVKAGKTGRLKSMQQFLKEKPSPLGVRFSEQVLSFHDRILSIPLYAVSQLERLVKSALASL